MSDLRQRRGAAPDSALEKNPPMTGEEFLANMQEQLRKRITEKVIKEGRYTTPEEIDQAVNEELEKRFRPKNVVPGIKNETKKAKDELCKDPNNIELIFQLGSLYMDEEKYVEASNVLIRGWKRVNELPEPADRYIYLKQLCLVSLRCGKSKQAHAIMKSIDEPEDPESFRDFCKLQCQVCCKNDQLTEAMKAFNKATAGVTKFEEAVPILAELATHLKKVGAYAAAKDTVERLATTDEDKLKLSTLEKIIDLQETVEASAKPQKFPQRLLLFAAFAAICLFLYILHWLESKSLQNLKLKP